MVRQNTQSFSRTSFSRNSFCTSSTEQGSVSAEWLRLPSFRLRKRWTSAGSRSSLKEESSTRTAIGMTAMSCCLRNSCGRSHEASIAKPIRMSPSPHPQSRAEHNTRLHDVIAAVRQGSTQFSIYLRVEVIHLHDGITRGLRFGQRVVFGLRDDAGGQAQFVELILGRAVQTAFADRIA